MFEGRLQESLCAERGKLSANIFGLKIIIFQIRESEPNTGPESSTPIQFSIHTPFRNSEIDILKHVASISSKLMYGLRFPFSISEICDLLTPDISARYC
jgi:hypothetical protein